MPPTKATPTSRPDQGVLLARETNPDVSGSVVGTSLDISRADLRRYSRARVAATGDVNGVLELRAHDNAVTKPTSWTLLDTATVTPGMPATVEAFVRDPANGFETATWLFRSADVVPRLIHIEDGDGNVVDHATVGRSVTFTFELLPYLRFS